MSPHRHSQSEPPDPAESSERQPQATEDRYRLLVHSVKDYAIFMLDIRGNVETWNAGAQAIKGYRVDEIVGRHISTFYTPEDRDAGRPQRLLAIATRDGVVEDEGWRVRKDGTRFWADVVITAVRDETGKHIGFSKVVRDLTAKQKAQEELRQSEERFRVLVQSVKDYAIFMLDPSGHVATWNAGAARIKGYSAAEIIGKHFSVFYPPEEVDSGKTERELQVALATGKFEEEGWRIRKDGSRFWANVVLEPLRDSNGKILGFAKVTRDLTERRAADAERLRLAQAQEAIRLRDEFLSIASHELKTPLTAVQLQLQNLLKASQSIDEKVRQRAERAYKGGERLSDLVETLLDVSRIATGGISLIYSRFDLVQAARDVIERFQEQSTQSGCEITLRVDGPIIGEWDRLRVEQILTNLLSNALKYAAGSRVGIQASARDDDAVFSVEDEGPGIPEADWERVFGRFERGASMRHYGGMGLGLYVARQIAEAHGGRIAIETVHPKGARFVVTLPLAKQKLNQGAPEVAV